MIKRDWEARFDRIDQLDQNLITIQDIVFSEGNQGIPQLIAYLDDMEPRSCWAASWALSRKWDERAAEPICRTLDRVEIYGPVLAHMKRTDVLYSLLKQLEPDDSDFDSRESAKRVAKALAFAYDERVESALMGVLAGGDSHIAEGALLPLMAHATGATLARVVDLGLHRFPYRHYWYGISRLFRPGLGSLFSCYIDDLNPKVRETARGLMDSFQEQEESWRQEGYLDPAVSILGASELDVEWPGKPKDDNFCRLWGMLAKPDTTGIAIVGLRNHLVTGGTKLSSDNLKAICGMRDTYLYRYEFFPAGYEYDPFFDIKALNVEDIISMAGDELGMRGDG